MPVKRVRLVIHTFAKDDGTEGFTDSSVHKEFINSVINHMRWFYHDIQKMEPYPAGKSFRHIPDSRIRFVVDTILFYRNSQDWDFLKDAVYINPKNGDTTFMDGRAFNGADKLHRKYVADTNLMNMRQRDSSLHIFFLRAHGKYSGKGIAHALGSKKWVFILDPYKDYLLDKNHWAPGMLLAHEVGHALGLNHPYGSTPCIDLPVTPRGGTNNIMDVWPNQGRALTPCQMGYLHWALSGHLRDIHHAVIKDWTIYHLDSVMRITACDTVVWERNQFLWGDLIIEPGAKLVVKCTLSMPPGSRIVVEPGGYLDVNAAITSLSGQQWQGIFVQRKRGLYLFRERPAGELLRGNNAVISLAEKEIREEKTQ
ncbi:MAG: hypothetical protein M3Q97_07275 [Bacteroidota bacterium]|nr:hypothetical protein [Bacteroidota bacterium]